VNCDPTLGAGGWDARGCGCVEDAEGEDIDRISVPSDEMASRGDVQASQLEGLYATDLTTGNVMYGDLIGGGLECKERGPEGDL
jgi:hypothetical protein